jgi:hypothetical protein
MLRAGGEGNRSPAERLQVQRAPDVEDRIVSGVMKQSRLLTRWRTEISSLPWGKALPSRAYAESGGMRLRDDST